MSDHKQGTELHTLMATGIPASDTQNAGLNQDSLIDGLDMDIEKTGDAVHTPAPAPEILVSTASPGPGLAVEADEKKRGFFGKVKKFLKVQLKKPVLFWDKTDKRTMLTASSCFVTVMMLCAMISLAVVAVHGESLQARALPIPSHFIASNYFLIGSRLAPGSAMARAVEMFHDPAPFVDTVTIQQRDQFSESLSNDTKVLPVTSTIDDICDDETGTVAVQS